MNRDLVLTLILMFPNMWFNEWSFAIIHYGGRFVEVSCFSSLCSLSYLSSVISSSFKGSSFKVSCLTTSSIITHQASKLERIHFPDSWDFLSSKETWMDSSTYMFYCWKHYKFSGRSISLIIVCANSSKTWFLHSTTPPCCGVHGQEKLWVIPFLLQKFSKWWLTNSPP